MYFQLAFAFDRLKAVAEQRQLRGKQPFKGALEKDICADTSAGREHSGQIEYSERDGADPVRSAMLAMT